MTDTGVRQEECGDIHRAGKRGLSVCGCTPANRKKNMANLKFDKEVTALLVIDPHNDFISEGGKVWDRLMGVVEANGCVPNML